MMSNVSPITSGNRNMAMHGSLSPEVGRPGGSSIKPRTTQMQYPSPPDNMPRPFSPASTHLTPAYPRSGSLSATAEPNNVYQQAASPYGRSNSVHSLQSAQGLTSSSTHPNASGPQRHASFSSVDAKMPESLYVRPTQQPTNPIHGAISPNQQHQPYMNNQGSNEMQVPVQPPFVNAQNFTQFSLPPPGFSPVAATTTSRDIESSYAISPPQTSMSADYQGRDAGHGQQSGPDMMLLDQMTAATTMPVFGGEGYNRSPFAIPDDFVAYLFSGQQWDNSSPMLNPALGAQGYAK